MRSDDIGPRIRESREAAGFKQVDLASRASLSLGTIRNYELGITQPTLDGIYAVAAALDVDVLWLLEGDAAEEVA